MNTHANIGLITDLKRIDALYQDGGLSIPEYNSCKTAAISSAELQYQVLPVSEIEQPLKGLKYLYDEGILTNEEWAEARHHILIHARIASDAVSALVLIKDYGENDLISFYDYDTTKRHLLGEAVWFPTLSFPTAMTPGVTDMRLVEYIGEVLDISEIIHVPGSAYWVRNLSGTATTFNYTETSPGTWTSQNDSSYSNLAFVQEQALAYSPLSGVTLATAGQTPRVGTLSIERLLEVLRGYSEREFDMIKAEVLIQKNTSGEVGYVLSKLYPLLTY